MIGVALILGLFYQRYLKDFPDIEQLPLEAHANNGKIFDCHGNVMHYLPHDKRIPIHLDQVPLHVIKAFLVAEDQNFFTHQGVHWLSVFRAFTYNCIHFNWANKPIGASTITQQLVKNLITGSTQTFDRKIKEVIMSYYIESKLSKQKILQSYFNTIYFGKRAYGLGAAAHIYFKKKVEDLTLQEGAFLASLPKAPSLYVKTTDARKVLQRRNWILKRMEEVGAISPITYRRAISCPLEVYQDDERYSYDYATLEVKRHLLKLQKHTNPLISDDVDVFSTIDRNLQEIAQTVLSKALEEVENAHTTPAVDNPLQGAIVIMDAHTGAVLAISGGRDVKQSSFNCASQAKRQLGSIFKPFVFAAALEKGYTPSTIDEDAPIRIRLSRTQTYQPKNYGNKSFGKIPLKLGLIRSTNQLSVRLAHQIGLDSIHHLATRCGLPMPKNLHYSSVLGALEFSVIDIVGAYAPFINGGYRIEPHLIEKIKSHTGQTLYKFPKAFLASIESTGNIILKDNRTKVLEDNIATSMQDMLVSVVSEGTARRLFPVAKRYGLQISGKTGTTNDNKDVWFIGSVKWASGRTWMIGVFVGYTQPQSLGKRATGSTIAAPIAKTLIEKIQTNWILPY